MGERCERAASLGERFAHVPPANLDDSLRTNASGPFLLTQALADNVELIELGEEEGDKDIVAEAEAAIRALADLPYIPPEANGPLRLLVTGDVVDAGTARSIGLINDAVPAGIL